jgi:hypothetical protein
LFPRTVVVGAVTVAQLRELSELCLKVEGMLVPAERRDTVVVFHFFLRRRTGSGGRRPLTHELIVLVTFSSASGVSNLRLWKNKDVSLMHRKEGPNAHVTL